ncbi:hypothetical protein WJ973_18450 [Achromobacter xylosoxidans]
MVTELTPACLRLTGPFELSRGYVACVSLAAAVGLTLLFLTALVDLYRGRTTLNGAGRHDDGLSRVCPGRLGLRLPIHFSPIQETTLVSRPLRRLYAWEKRTGWTSVDFDRAQAYVGNYHVVTTTGAERPIHCVPSRSRPIRAASSRAWR